MNATVYLINKIQAYIHAIFKKKMALQPLMPNVWRINRLITISKRRNHCCLKKETRANEFAG